jgi:hypothetical protein
MILQLVTTTVIGVRQPCILCSVHNGYRLSLQASSRFRHVTISVMRSVQVGSGPFFSCVIHLHARG